MRLVARAECVFCQSSDHIDTSVTHHPKVGIDTWGGKVVECVTCGSQWTTPVPSPVDYETMYRTRYDALSVGLPRWRERFPGLIFGSDSVVLEIGGALGGMKAVCSGAYHAWEFDDAATLTGLFDAATDEQIERARVLGITDIVALDCYEHVLDPRQFIVNCHRILAPGGLLYVAHGELKGQHEHGRRKGGRQAAHINCPSGAGMAAVLAGLFEVIKGDAGTCAEDRDAAWVMRRL